VQVEEAGENKEAVSGGVEGKETFVGARMRSKEAAF
jgi:hypothetical protein